MKAIRRVLVLTGLMALPGARGAQATIVDTTNFTEVLWAPLAREVLWNPVGNDVTGMAWAPDGSKRLFLTMKSGAVRILKWGTPPTAVAAPFVTIAPLYTTSECGVTGIAFDPNFQVNQYVYFFVTVAATEQQIIRYTALGDVGTDKTIIMSGLPTLGVNHDGGAIGFGPDGKLYWGIGDNGAGSGVNTDLTSLAAKIGRANRDGTVPFDNPFRDGVGPNNDYIWARGVRNPFTLTMRPTTGALWVNVVGTSFEQVFVIKKGDHAGYNAFENNQPDGFITPIIKYRTNVYETFTIAPTGAQRAGDITTFTTTVAHGLRQGEKVTIAGVQDPSFNGAFYLTGTPTPTTFTVAAPAPPAAPNATSGGGGVTTLSIGGCITGGAFYDGTQFGPAYRDNFFFGDYNSGRIMRAVLGPGNTVTSVDYWASGVSFPIDTAVGPDGALYYVGYGGDLYRVTANASTQALVLSGAHLWMAEGGRASVTVSLAMAPTAEVSVVATRVRGDGDVSISAGSALTFTPTNWNVPQPITISAADDPDTTLDTATFDVTASGLAPVSVDVNVVDDETNALVISPTALGINEGSSGTFTIALAAVPTAPVTVTVVPSSGDADITVTGGARLTFDAANYANPQSVTVSTAVDPDTTDDAATISISTSDVGIAPRTVTVIALEPRPDASASDAAPNVDGGAGRDAGTAGERAADGGTRQASGSGCGCALGETPELGGGVWLWMLALALARARRRRGHGHGDR
jgi:MYXO-CTERM domain-containing protein